MDWSCHVFKFNSFTHVHELANNLEPESNKALVSRPSTITLDSFASPTNLPDGSGL